MTPRTRRGGPSGPPATTTLAKDVNPHNSRLVDVVADSALRARSLDRLLRADVALDPEMRRALARLADRVAVDLARADRDLTIMEMAA